MSMELNSKFFLCECQTEGLLISYDKSYNEYYIQHLSAYNLSFWNRFKKFFKFLFFNEQLLRYEVIFSRDEMCNITEFISSGETSLVSQTKL